MDKIAIFISRYPINSSLSILNFLEILSIKYKIDLYLYKVFDNAESLKNNSIFEDKNIKVIFVDKRIRLFFLKFKFLFKKFRKPAYKNFVCFDPFGFVLCKEFFPKSKPYYYSLELYIKHDHFGLYYPKNIMEKERKFIKDIKGFIIQSEEKEILFRNDYEISNLTPSMIVPVTHSGEFDSSKYYIIKDKYKISKNKKIALHLGGISEWFSCIDLAICFSKIENWVLFFQGYPDKNYKCKFEEVLNKNNIKNVIISNETYDLIEDVNPILKSSDIGIAWYNDISIGFRTAGLSSGKISSYIRFGLPILAKKYPSTSKAIEETGCGICINNIEEIPNAIRKIENKYEEFVVNEQKEFYKNYHIENYKNKLIKFVT